MKHEAADSEQEPEYICQFRGIAKDKSTLRHVSEAITSALEAYEARRAHQESALGAVGHTDRGFELVSRPNGSRIVMVHPEWFIQNYADLDFSDINNQVHFEMSRDRRRRVVQRFPDGRFLACSHFAEEHSFYKIYHERSIPDSLDSGWSYLCEECYDNFATNRPLQLIMLTDAELADILGVNGN